jgi:FixJ family two-component response regulator
MAELGPHSALIAVVDDEHGICHAVSSLLRSAGYRCVAFGSAEAFLESGRLADTDCLLLDVRMPGMDGTDLHLRLKQMLCHIPVIYVTAALDARLRERAFRQGAIAFLPKPFDDEELLSAIHAALNGHGKTRRDTPAQPDCH